MELCNARVRVKLGVKGRFRMAGNCSAAHAKGRLSLVKERGRVRFEPQASLNFPALTFMFSPAAGERRERDTPNSLQHMTRAPQHPVAGWLRTPSNCVILRL